MQEEVVAVCKRTGAKEVVCKHYLLTLKQLESFQ